jgi:hypothetical protein
MFILSIFFFPKKKQIIPANLYFRYNTVADEKLEEKPNADKQLEKTKDLFTKLKEKKWLKKDVGNSIKELSMVKPIPKFQTFSSSRLSQSCVNSLNDDF